MKLSGDTQNPQLDVFWKDYSNVSLTLGSGIGRLPGSSAASAYMFYRSNDDTTAGESNDFWFTGPSGRVI